MNKFILLFTFTFIGIISVLKAQTKEVSSDVRYRRSSLHTMLLETGDFPRKDTVIRAFNTAPFPEKYNNHSIPEKDFDPRKYVLTDSERAGLPQEHHSKLYNLAAEYTGGGDTSTKELPFKILKYFKENKIANKLVAKWFDRDSTNGSFDWYTIADRGLMNASFLDIKTAKASADGIAILKTAGFDLIGNTFVVVNKFNFVSNEIVAAEIRNASIAEAQSITIPALKTVALKVADEAYQKEKEGYSVWATAFLYQLVWNDSISSIFFNNYYMEKEKLDPKKKIAFDTSSLFQLKYVGEETAISLVTFSIKEKRTEDQIVQVATIRTIDAVYAKLQRKFDVFKTKTPLYSGNPITAKIGLKEGLEAGDKFEVLEQTLDPKTGVVKYVNKGTITVEKHQIWDNRYDATSDLLPNETANKPSIDATTFKGGKNYYPGMLIKQIR